jgi:hypothetical protein
MSEQELNFHSIAQGLTTPTLEPSADLWSRIAQVHLTRQQQRRRRRFGGAALAVVIVLLVAGIAARLPHRAVVDRAATDWEARAQALELELYAHATPAGIESPIALDTESELAQVDRALQGVYDRGGEKSELVPLWKQRSELLSALLAARRQSLTVTHI